MDDDVTPEDLARLMGLATRRVLELEAEVERLRGALRSIADFTASNQDPTPPYEQLARQAKAVARAALG